MGLLSDAMSYWGDKSLTLAGLLQTGAEQGAGMVAPTRADRDMRMKIGGLLAEMSPGLGDALSVKDGVQAAREGDYLGAGLGALGALPFVPALGGVVKGMEGAKWAHGTIGDFDAFRTRLGGVKLMDGLGPHFGTPQAANERLQKSYGKGLVEGANIRPLDPVMNNPLTKKSGDPFSESELQSYLQAIAKKLGFGNKRLRGNQAYQVSGDAQLAVRNYLKEQGYDGVLYRNSHEDRGSVSGIVFDPSQMQSAIKPIP